jgi:hypothetical protein
METGLNNSHLPASFEEALHQHLIFYSKVTCVLAMVLVAGGVGLDAAFYPEKIWEFALARLLVVALICLVAQAYPSAHLFLDRFATIDDCVDGF